MVTKKFSCPTCNAGCGLLVEVEDNKVISIRPDPDYPLTKGYCCPKGMALGAITNDPDRVRTPLKRVEDRFIAISWKQAIHEIAEKFKKIRSEYSPHSIAYYLGTNSVHQYAHSMFAVGFMDAIGSYNMYNAGSVDNNNKFVAQNLLYGSSVVMPIPDLPKTDLIILIGTNPAITNFSLVTCSNIMKHLKEIQNRGGEIYIIDPRRNETAKILTKADDGNHIPIYPDTDVYLLLAMIYVLIEENLVDTSYIQNNTTDFEMLRDLIKDFTPQCAEKCCGIPTEKIYELARKFGKTKKAVIYARLGTCLCNFATLNAWAVEVLNILGGKLDRPGGSVFGKNVINISKLGGIVGQGSFDTHRSRIGKYPDVMGAFPLGILAREILAPKDPIKALIISGGNPLLSAPNSHEFQKALEKLDLCVMLDFYLNETANFCADYVLPTRTPLENSNAPVYLLNYQVFPHLEYTKAVIEVDKYGPKPEWEILLSLTRVMGLRMFGNVFLNLIPKLFSFLHKHFHPEFFIKMFLFLGQLLEGRIPKLSSRTFTVKELKKNDTILLENNDYGVIGKYIQTKDKRIPLLNVYLEAQLKECKNAYLEKLNFIESVKKNAHEFLMIGRRNLKTMNSWMHNIKSLWRKKQEPSLFIHPQDAKKLDIMDEERVLIENEFGSLELPIKITPEMMPSVVCYPHGWGHKNPHLSFANQHPGENVNVLTDSHRLDALSGQPVMNGYKIFLTKID